LTAPRQITLGPLGKESMCRFLFAIVFAAAVLNCEFVHAQGPPTPSAADTATLELIVPLGSTSKSMGTISAQSARLSSRT